MTGDEYKTAIAKLGLTQEGAANFLDLSLATSHKYANDSQRIPHPVAMLLRLMVKRHIKPETVK